MKQLSVFKYQYCVLIKFCCRTYFFKPQLERFVLQMLHEILKSSKSFVLKLPQKEAVLAFENDLLILEADSLNHLHT